MSSRINPRILTTDEMDGIFTEKDRKHRDHVHIFCENCSQWTEIYGYKHNDKYECANCEKSQLDLKSITSHRTFDPFRKRRGRGKR